MPPHFTLPNRMSILFEISIKYILQRRRFFVTQELGHMAWSGSKVKIYSQVSKKLFWIKVNQITVQNLQSQEFVKIFEWLYSLVDFLQFGRCTEDMFWSEQLTLNQGCHGEPKEPIPRGPRMLFPAPLTSNLKQNTPRNPELETQGIGFSFPDPEE